MLAAGAGLELVRRLDAGEGTVGFCAVRPPGHHATADPGAWASACSTTWRSPPRPWPSGASGSRSSTTTRTTATAPRTSSTRTRGCSTCRCTSGRCTPAPGRSTRSGRGAGAGTTLNVPLPAGTTGDVYRRALDELVVPAHRALRPHVAAALGRVRRPPGRPADRAGPVRRRLRRPHRSGWSRSSRRAGASSSSRAATTSRGCVTRSAASLAATVGVDVRPEPATGGDTGADRLAAVLNFHRADADG